jgi:hypothetical protein
LADEAGTMQVISASPPALTRVRNPANSAWCRAIFGSRMAQEGGIVRRVLRDVEREIGFETLELEVRRRGFHMVLCGAQVIIICTMGDLRVIC